MLSINLVACSKPQTETKIDNNTTIENSQVTETKIDNNELSQFLYRDKAVFGGTLDYGHYFEDVNSKVQDGETQVLISGRIDDLSGGESSKNKDYFKFNIAQSIHNDELIESYVAKNTRSFSIINEKIALKLPINYDTSWTQNVNIEGKKYLAKSKIELIQENIDGKKIVTVKTTIDNISGYKNNAYTETSTYEEGKGLIKFSKTLPSDIGMDFQMERINSTK